MKRLSFVAALLCLAWPSLAQAGSTPDTPPQFVARCVAITDGDTLKVLYVEGETKSEIKIRLFGIDAPEKKQAFGTQAKTALSELAFGKDLNSHFHRPR